MYTTFFICSGEEDSSSEAEDSLSVDEQPAKAPVPPVVPVQVKKNITELKGVENSLKSKYQT